MNWTGRLLVATPAIEHPDFSRTVILLLQHDEEDGALGLILNRPLVTEIAEVDYVVITAGAYDLLVEVVCESDAHLLERISTRLRTIEGVVATETFMYLQLRKQTYSWGVR